jgi:transposase
MTVTPNDPADLATLETLVAAERDALQRDRYRAVLLALGRRDDGSEWEGDQIAATIDRSPRFVDQWLARYRKGGIAALAPRKAKGRTPKLTEAQRQALKARVLAGPRPEADGGLCTLRGPDVRRILAAEFGVEMKLAGVYKLLHRCGLSCLRPRPRHRKNDPEAMKAWLERAPLLRRT